VTEIRVQVPEGFTGFELSSYRREHAEVVPLREALAVLVNADGHLPAVLSEIRDWLGTADLTTINIEIDGHQYILEAD
jgi:hypothetical protein